MVKVNKYSIDDILNAISECSLILMSNDAFIEEKLEIRDSKLLNYVGKHISNLMYLLRMYKYDNEDEKI